MEILFLLAYLGIILLNNYKKKSNYWIPHYTSYVIVSRPKVTNFAKQKKEPN